MKQLLALTMIASTLLLAGCCTTAHREHAVQWEYKRVKSIAEVNRAAAEGWVVEDFTAYFKLDRLNQGQPETRYTEDVEVYLLKRPNQ